MASATKMPPDVIASDLEESEVEGGVESRRNHRYPRLIEGIYEYYQNRKALRRHGSTVACQTSPGHVHHSTNLSAVGENLACELRTGLGNMIHTLYGHLESRLLAGDKIPEAALLRNYVGYLKELELLLGQASKLSVMMPCTKEDTENYLKQVQENEALLTEMVKKAELKISGADVNYTAIQGAPCCSRMPGNSSKDFVASTKPKFHGNYAAGAAPPAEKKKIKGAKKVLFSSDIKVDPASSRGPNYERKPLASNVRHEPSSSRVTKRTGNGQENHPQAQSSTTKDFIKRNIMAVKTRLL